MTVQISKHTSEGVDISINFGVMAHWFFRTTVLKESRIRNMLAHKDSIFNQHFKMLNYLML